MAESERTKDIRRRYEIPDGLHLRADHREVLACVPGYEIAVRAVAAHPDALPASRRQGRRPLAQLECPLGYVLVREYRKGGLLRLFRGRRFLGSYRPLSELVLHGRLQGAGVPVPDAVGAVVLRGLVGWRGFLLTRAVPDSIDLEAWLYGVPFETLTGRDDVLREAGRAVRRLHDAGVPHPDLHPKNLLVTKRGEVVVIDLDKASARDQPLGDASRVANLTRLGRAIEKHRLKGLPVGRREALRFLEGYSGSVRAAGQWFDRIRARLLPSLPLRTIWWRLIGEARPWAGGAALASDTPLPQDAGLPQDAASPRAAGSPQDGGPVRDRAPIREGGS